MSISFTNSVPMQIRARALLPLCAGAGAYLYFLFIGDIFLQDSDSFWQIKVGQWILDHSAVPYTDLYSFTRFGQPWISTSWLSQVLFAVVYAKLGWAGPVILTSLAIGLATAIFVYRLDAQIDPARSVLFAMLAALLSLPHLLARPHILALPVTVAWVSALMAAADRKDAPSWLWLPLMALWANLHGGFVLGLALIAPIALEAVWAAEADRRLALARRWMLFAFGALIASCCTPYGWRTLAGAANILNLGELLSVISEWKSANFSSFTPFEGAVLGIIALGFYRGIILSPPRILLILGLVWMALTHVRSLEAFAFLVPLVLAKPLAGRQPAAQTDGGSGVVWPARGMAVLAAAMIVAASWTSTSIYMGHHRFAFTARQTPDTAVDILMARKPVRIFNAYEFGGYLISRNIPVFVDGRAELYGEKFVMDFFKAVAGKNVDGLTELLGEYRIDATLLVADAPAAQVLDHLPGWKRIYSDNTAVVHVRDVDPTRDAALATPGRDEERIEVR